MTEEEKEAKQGAISQYITERFDQSKYSPCSSIARGTGPVPPQVCSELKQHYTGDTKGGWLTESGIVKHYGDVQIRNSQEEISCSVTHALQTHKNAHAHTALYSAKFPSCFLAKAIFHTLADRYRGHILSDVNTDQTLQNDFPVGA